MLPILFRKHVPAITNEYIHNFSVLFFFFSYFQVLRKEKLTVELLSEVENVLISGKVKHRKHPGIRKIHPISVPEILRASIDNILSGRYTFSLDILLNLQ